MNLKKIKLFSKMAKLFIISNHTIFKNNNEEIHHIHLCKFCQK